MTDGSTNAPDSDVVPDSDAESEDRGRRDTLLDLHGQLEAIRADPSRRRIALAVAALLGLAAAWVHWLGLFVAGALVGLVSETFPRALAAGLGVGVLVLALHVLASPAMSAGEFLALTPVSYVTIAVALVAPLWGSLIRGVV